VPYELEALGPDVAIGGEDRGGPADARRKEAVTRGEVRGR
jgi:hypothetical protein